MQTGPAPNQSMRNWLARTGLLEWFNVGLFSFLLWRSAREPGSPIGPFAVLGLVTLNLVLIEGGLYWLLKRRHGGTPRPAIRRLRLLRAVYAGNALLLLLFPAALLATIASGDAPTGADVLIGCGLYLFGLGEFAHYFLFKINMRPAEWRRAWRARHPVPARILREYRRARADTRRQGRGELA